MSSIERRRKRKRLEAGIDIHPPLLFPTQRAKTLAQSKVKIFNRWEKKEMIFPCCYQFSNIILFDSIGKFFNGRLLPELGYSCFSYSGLDLVDLLVLLNYGRLFLNQTDEKPITYKNRSFFGNRNGTIPQHSVCRTCNHNCAKIFNGNLIIQVSLNNSLKASYSGFENQNISNIFRLVELKIEQMFPKLKKLVWIRPLRPIEEKWVRSAKNRFIFKEILDQLKNKKYCIGDEQFAIDEKAHCYDGIHLRRDSSERYFRIILSKLEELLSK